ncbi:RNA-binding protein [Cyanobacterium sp. IPPAS B-1200]|uniref:RNA recognition motif domain-containing protein n=1 Tax=Cyanobacterium sp. IPPAS B-1200 TaxID=1562720 RepID=UPI0008527320|nr:RNA-binding protein [Cyanobacterium sp. IPPAS B-1200]OEJ78332.1 RNA-binding protein [Cyanobacterium sp. IPPAS B-1200]
MSVRLYVKLPKAELEKESLEKMFSEFEPPFTTKLIKERKKNECRGFGFVTVPSDEAADEFITKYNDQTLIYNGEPFKDEEGNDFTLFIEKALPRNKNEKEGSEGDAGEVESSAEVAKVTEKPSKRTGAKKAKKGRKTSSKSGSKSFSVADSAQPDPRWADELSKLKEMFTSQTTN